MITIDDGDLGKLMRAASTGPFMQAEIVSLTGRGKLRVTCNWLYSSLNCDPNDNSPFAWQFNKIDDQHISLSPVNSCIGETIYASVRPDINYYVQVQAPYSADWITAVGGDEIIGFTLHDLSIGQLNGLNGAYITLNDFEDNHDGHSGYRVTSTGSSFSQDAQWFIAIQSSLQEGVQFSGQDHSLAALQQQLTNCNISVASDTLARIATQIAS